MTYIPIVNLHRTSSWKAGQDNVSKIPFAATWVVTLSPFEDKKANDLFNLARDVILLVSLIYSSCQKLQRRKASSAELWHELYMRLTKS